MITKKTLLYNFIFGASTDTKIKTYYHLLEPLFHTMSDHNMFLNLGYHDKNYSFPNSIVNTQKNMIENVTKDFDKSGLWLDVGCGTGAPACYLSKMYDDIEIEVLKNCPSCNGSGSNIEGGSRTCPSCEGRGRIDEISMIGPFRQRVRKDCAPCRGSGRLVTDPCSECNGDGRSLQSIQVKFSVSPGITSGNRLRMRGQGEAPNSLNGYPGDLYIEIEVEKHQWFERDGADLLMALPLSFADLTLGTTVEIPHIDSENLTIKVPPSSNPGETITIHGRGLPFNGNSSRRGSVTVVLRLQSPKKTTRSLKNKIKEIRAELEESIPPIEERIREEANSRRGR